MDTNPVRRVLTGMRTTGQLHLGHYVGALKLWIDAVNEGYDCYLLLADVQALTTHADKPELIQQSVRDVVLDWMAVGLDPTLPNVHFVLQSGVRARFEISQYLLMIANLGEIQRNPTIKAEMKNLKIPSMGFMTYPVDQAADIYMVSPEKIPGNELVVPVGEDQVPHLEFSRVLARRFNKIYRTSIFLPCRAKVGEIGRLVGTDGKEKMSKSGGNAICLADDPEIVKKKIMGLYTDPTRLRVTDPGHIEGNPLFIYLDAFATDKAEIDEYKRLYQNGQIGDVPLKKRLAEIVEALLVPMRERRAEVENTNVMEHVRRGTAEASVIADSVLARMKSAMFLFNLKEEDNGKE